MTHNGADPHRAGSAPLRGIRVLDLSRLLPGPYCTMLLRQMGAEVVKVEDPQQGDYLRWMPPLGADGESAMFAALNRGKRSVALDLRNPDARAAFLRLVPRFDVVLDGFRPGVMQKLGVGPDVLRDIHPGLVYCALTGYGQNGPYSDRAGHDVNYLSIAGVIGLTGGHDGTPVIPGTQVADLGGGAQLAAVAILGALVDRLLRGEGAFLDVSMLDGALGWLGPHFASVALTGETPKPAGMTLTGRYPCYDIYATRDGGHLSLGALEPKFWRAFCAAIGRTDLEDGQFADGEAGDRVRHEVQRTLASDTRDAWTERLQGLEVCCEPVLALDEVARHPQVRARGLRPGATSGQERGTVPEWGSTDPGTPPRLGADNVQILAEIGIDAQEALRFAARN
ncbi:MAG: CaiB/BaiF CoA transferase family protein [Candidatus Dormibacteria bacterium]